MKTVIEEVPEGQRGTLVETVAAVRNAWKAIRRQEEQPFQKQERHLVDTLLSLQVRDAFKNDRDDMACLIRVWLEDLRLKTRHQNEADEARHRQAATRTAKGVLQQHGPGLLRRLLDTLGKQDDITGDTILDICGLTEEDLEEGPTGTQNDRAQEEWLREAPLSDQHRQRANGLFNRLARMMGQEPPQGREVLQLQETLTLTLTLTLADDSPNH